MSTHPSLLSEIIREIVEEIGATLWLEPEFEQAGIITFQNGKRYLYLGRNLNLNPSGTIHISRNKGYTHMFLEKFGYPVIPGKTFFAPKLASKYPRSHGPEEALEYADSLGYPVIVKPNTKSQGKGVQKADTREECMTAIESILPIDEVYRVEKCFVGQDYRIVVLDGEVISAYERVPLSVTGDGVSSIASLLEAKQAYFDSVGRDTRIALDDSRIVRKLSKSGYTLMSILKRDERVPLLDNANLSTGGESRDVTSTLHDDYRSLAIAVTRDMGLRLCGVDIMTRSPIEEGIGDPTSVAIIEINGAPGLDHYVTTGAAQREIVKSLYKKILLAIENENESGFSLPK